jgi:hypothetical protein
MRKETCEIRFIEVKILRFVLSATRVLDLEETLRESSFIGTVAFSYLMP